MKLLHIKRTTGYVFILSCFVAVAIFIFVLEYYKFRTITAQLLELKEEYRVYTLALKKNLDTKTEQTDQKKKDEESNFIIVNRDDDYLFENALQYAKECKLEKQVAQLLDVTVWEKQIRPSVTFKKKGKRFVGAQARLRHSAFLPTAPKDFSFSWPIDQSKFWLSSLFGPRKIKNTGQIKYHYGIDMAAHKGTPVKAAASGIVLESYWHNGYGNCIIVAHNKKYKTRYAHLNTRRVKVGQKVQKGAIIGTVGDTGLVRKSGKDASHLHFEVYAFERHINPLTVLI